MRAHSVGARAVQHAQHTQHGVQEAKLQRRRLPRLGGAFRAASRTPRHLLCSWRLRRPQPAALEPPPARTRRAKQRAAARSAGAASPPGPAAPRRCQQAGPQSPSGCLRMSASESESEGEAWRSYPVWCQAAVKEEEHQENQKTVRVLDSSSCGGETEAAARGEAGAQRSSTRSSNPPKQVI